MHVWSLSLRGAEAATQPPFGLGAVVLCTGGGAAALLESADTLVPQAAGTLVAGTGAQPEYAVVGEGKAAPTYTAAVHAPSFGAHSVHGKLTRAQAEAALAAHAGGLSPGLFLVRSRDDGASYGLTICSSAGGSGPGSGTGKPAFAHHIIEPAADGSGMLLNRKPLGGSLPCTTLADAVAHLQHSTGKVDMRTRPTTLVAPSR